MPSPRHLLALLLALTACGKPITLPRIEPRDRGAQTAEDVCGAVQSAVLASDLLLPLGGIMGPDLDRQVCLARETLRGAAATCLGTIALYRTVPAIPPVVFDYTACDVDTNHPLPDGVGLMVGGGLDVAQGAMLASDLATTQPAEHAVACGALEAARAAAREALSALRNGDRLFGMQPVPIEGDRCANDLRERDAAFMVAD